MASPLGTFRMQSSDLIKKEPLDYGSFGEVYLCYHKTLGQVVLKTVYTGCLHNEGSKRSLLEEGSLMTRLNHERVVKLLGVVVEDGDYSLVMELIPKGNLLAMLKQVSVPISIKGRIILEILEGMVYLTKNLVIHKDLKPENILVDKDFHIKIADLGLATCQSWSKLTREESRRKSRLGGSKGTRGAGTLSYMAPEHLDNINIRSTEKSDVYSFAIVVWVILTSQDPYEHARSEDHVCQCVRKGDRPAEDLIPEETPKEMTQLMTRCWHHEPQQRPAFEESYRVFLPFYRENLEQFIEGDSLRLRELYDGPEELVRKRRSMSFPPENFSSTFADCPAPLRSSERGVPGPVEATVEDLSFFPCADPVEPSVECDARCNDASPSLESKLNRELQYHKQGSYTYVDQPDSANPCQPGPPSNLVPLLRRAASEHAARRPAQDQPSQFSSVLSFTRSGSVGEPVQATSREDVLFVPTPGLYESMGPLSNLSLAETLTQLPHGGHSHHDPQKLRPLYLHDTTAPDLGAGHRCSNKMCSLQDSGAQGLFIQNASAIQIGNNNSLSIRSLDSLGLGPSHVDAWSALKEALLKYGEQAVTEEHLDLLRDNIGSNWKQCARRLRLTKVEVEAIDYDYARDGLQEKVHQMLERWRMKEGSAGCTVGRLCRALEGFITTDLFQKILDTYESASPP